MSYEEYSSHYLVAIYYFISRNMKRGILSQAMAQELSLIRQVLKQRGIVVYQTTFNEKGLKKRMNSAIRTDFVSMLPRA
ncbi:MAG: hypothetical protein ABF868_00010 [Sporolactobacillus sp.]